MELVGDRDKYAGKQIQTGSVQMGKNGNQVKETLGLVTGCSSGGTTADQNPVVSKLSTMPTFCFHRDMIFLSVSLMTQIYDSLY